MKTTAEPVTPLWLSIPDAARLVGISRTRIYELIKAGRIRSASLRDEGQSRGSRLIDRNSLLRYIESRAEGGEAQDGKTGPPPDGKRPCSKCSELE